MQVPNQSEMALEYLYFSYAGWHQCWYENHSLNSKKTLLCSAVLLQYLEKQQGADQIEPVGPEACDFFQVLCETLGGGGLTRK